MTTLAAELEQAPAWMYPWDINGRQAPILGPELPSIHETRAAMIEPYIRSALPGTAVDLGCSEGWFAHKLLKWGAESVHAIDVRETNVRRARLIRDHYGIPSDRLIIDQQDIYETTANAADVVLCLGLIYHLENPIGALRLARSLTRRICAVETQAAITAPARYTWGTTGEYLDTEAVWATRVEPADDQSLTTLASVNGVVSLIPNRAALIEAMTSVGFRDVEIVAPPANGNSQYHSGDRLVAVGRV